MASLPVPFDPYNPIPNNPFYSVPTNYLQGPLGPLVIGSGLSVSPLGVISSTGGGGGGTVTAITAGAGLSGGVITSTGTIALTNTGVTPGTYTFATVVVDVNGRITGASNGSPVTGVNVNFPLLKAGSSTSPTLSVAQASTTQVGVTQLNNTTSSSLTNQALTAAAGYSLQQQINALSQGVSGLILAGTLDASTGFVVNPPTTAGAAAGFVGGAVVPAATTALNNYYLIVTTAAASYTPTGGSAITNVRVGDYILVASGAWTILRVGPVTGAYATTLTPGVVELATVLEVQTGTDPNLVVTPFTGSSNYVMNKCFTSSGQVLASTGVGTYSALPAGTDTYVLTADSSCAAGVKWAAPTGGGGALINVTFNSPLSSTTNPYTGGVAGVSIAGATTSSCGAVQLADTAATQAGVSTTLALTPAGAAATYFAYCDFTTKGQITVATGASTYCVLPAGPDGCVLTTCAACAPGVFWGSNIPAAATSTTLGTVYGKGEPGAGQNMSVGSSSLASLTTGLANTALGIGSMALATSACCNVAVGICSLYTEATGCFNTAVGTGALKLQTGDNNNTAVGFSALGNTTVGGNTAVGSCALCTLTIGLSNTAVGTASLKSETDGNFNTALGFCALSTQAATDDNTAVGANALNKATTGCQNTALGSFALCGITTGYGNVGIGWVTANALTSGFYNVLIGNGAAAGMTSGFCNTVVGTNAGAALTTGNNNIFIGDNAGDNITTQCDQFVIGQGSSCTLATATGGVTFQFGSTCAAWLPATNTGTWLSTSDASLKEEVADLALGLDFVNQLQPRTYVWKEDKRKAAGFIAQEADAVVTANDADYLGFVDKSNELMAIGPSALIPVLVNAIKELKAEVDELKAKLG